MRVPAAMRICVFVLYKCSDSTPFGPADRARRNARGNDGSDADVKRARRGPRTIVFRVDFVSPNIHLTVRVDTTCTATVMRTCVVCK